MKPALKAFSILISLIVLVAFTQKTPTFSFCGKTGNTSMSWDEFIACKKELTVTDSKTSINSFMVTIQKAEKKDTLSVQYKCKKNQFSPTLLEAIEKLHKSKKMGNKILIEDVELLQSGQAARKDPGITIMLH